MNRIFTTMIMVAALSLGAAAQDEQEMRGFDITSHNLGKEEKQLAERFESDAAARNAKKEIVPIKFMLGKEAQYWTNGVDIIATFYNATTATVERDYMELPLDEVSVLPNMKVTKGKLVNAEARTNKITVERYGNYTMLVERDAKGGFLKAFYQTSLEDINNRSWQQLFLNTLFGKYITPKGEAAIFGPVVSTYGDVGYNSDPGLFAYRINKDFNEIYIQYGFGRVSGGNPSAPGYGKMPGGGGAGALMGPMEWIILPTTRGLRVGVIRDEPYVNHSPRIGEMGELVNLTKDQCPWEGVPGKWAFASVMPLTTTMLQAFSVETLELIKGEIYARHGDKFAKAATQDYFNEQPWYKRSTKAVVLTDVERFNVAVIKRAIALRKKQTVFSSQF